MTHWSESDPGAGDMSVVRQRMSKHSDHLGHAGEMMSVVRLQTGYMSEFWTGGGHAGWTASADRALAEWTALQTWAENDYLALSRYASTVESIQERAAREQGRLTDAQLQLTLLQGAPRDPFFAPVEPGVEYSEAAAQAARAIARLAAERQEADDALAAAIRGAQQHVVSASQGALPSSGELAGMSPIGLLSEFSLLSSTQLEALLASDPSVADVVRSLDPSVVATWWASLDGPAPIEGHPRQPSAAQKALIHGIPSLIGNLDGVAYWARDRANHVTLAAEITRLELHPEGDGSTLAALKAVRNALGKGIRAAPPRELVSLSLDGKPKAAISVGDLDAAAHVSYVIPGMGTQVAGDIGQYANAAFNLKNSQALVSGQSAERTAVVAWLDYDPPGPTDSPGVQGNYLAEAGGLRLAKALQGFHATRGVSGVASNLSVVGHSYGTNVATLALTRTRADHVVLLGSAGVADRVTSANSLRIPTGEVFASQGHHDGWAPVGQWIGNRQDPTAPSFQAHTFSSEAGVDDQGRPLHEVGQHGPLVNDGSNGKYSYLDSQTSSMYNTAKATMGLGSELDVAGTPSDRLALQIQDRVRFGEVVDR